MRKTWKKSKNLDIKKEETKEEKEYRSTIKEIPTEFGLIDLEILLINSLGITADKVQQVAESFMIGKKYVSMFCFTETRVRSIGFKTEGIKIHSKERTTREKNGGGLAIGYIENQLIELEEVDTQSNDILVIEGKVYNKNIRIILTYMDCTKTKSGKDFEHNREIQKKIEK